MWMALSAEQEIGQLRKQRSPYHRSRHGIEPIWPIGGRARVALGRRPLRRNPPPKLASVDMPAMMIAATPSSPTQREHHFGEQAALPPINPSASGVPARSKGSADSSTRISQGYLSRRPVFPVFSRGAQPTSQLLPQLLPSSAVLNCAGNELEKEGHGCGGWEASHTQRRASPGFVGRPAVNSPSQHLPRMMIQTSPAEFRSRSDSTDAAPAAGSPPNDPGQRISSGRSVMSTSRGRGAPNAPQRSGSFRDPLNFQISSPKKLETRKRKAAAKQPSKAGALPLAFSTAVCGKQPLRAISKTEVLEPPHESTLETSGAPAAAISSEGAPHKEPTTPSSGLPVVGTPESKKAKQPSTVESADRAMPPAEEHAVKIANPLPKAADVTKIDERSRQTALDSDTQNAADKDAGDAKLSPMADSGSEEVARVMDSCATEDVVVTLDVAANDAELPTLTALINGALPKAPPGSLQQQADSIMMLLRADWKGASAVDDVESRVHATLLFFERLSHKAASLKSLQGTLLQALVAHLAAEQQRIRAEEERQWRIEELAAARAEAEAAGEEFCPPEVDMDEDRRMLRSGGAGLSGAQKAVLDQLSKEEVSYYSQEADAMKKLVRIKVEDDNDLATARRAVAEAGHFILLLRSEATERGLSTNELLKKCEYGEA
ncbi:hypothetical protein AB1Y20_019141 [Prymnesium parvum]|uniref:Uncharacterized protein n=1 Tax=Prymnesium parvum TaxID=97485 RepID=A0AB34JUB2_PRYPA